MQPFTLVTFWGLGCYLLCTKPNMRKIVSVSALYVIDTPLIFSVEIMGEDFIAILPPQ